MRLIIPFTVMGFVLFILFGCAYPYKFSLYPPGQGPQYDPILANAVRTEIITH